MSIKLSTTFSKKKGNPFLVIDNGRFPNPWLSPDDLQALLDNEAAVRSFIAEHRSKPSLTVLPRPVTPTAAVPAPTPKQASEPSEVAPAPPAPPAPLPKEEGVSEASTPRVQAQTDITSNINPRVAALVAKAMGTDCPGRTPKRRFTSLN